ncbi:carbamoyl phosphate synthase small subunit [Alteribacillus iranensis]|nr:carbamoyl phosphate synthase small subunit [Alteribacillus iranensis]
MTTGYLVLETGEVFEGEWIGAEYEIAGEVVFNTGMTGYQEMMTDPSYAGQILTFSYPLIGNYGLNETDDESFQVSASAILAGEVTETPNHYQSHSTMTEKLMKANIPGLKNIDTRAVVAAVRKHQTVRGKIVFNERNVKDDEDWGVKENAALVDSVTVQEMMTYGSGNHHVVLVDFGYKKSILTALLENDCKVTVVPYNTSYDTIQDLYPDGVLFSNGPGDPMEMKPYFTTIKKLTQSYPSLGICLGHQVIALAYGASTEKMPFGHRGSNHPVIDTTTGKVWITSQNHGYVVIENSVDSNEFEVLFRNVNDKTVEGMRHISLPLQSVQFHPEAHPGPSDTAYVFDDFIKQVSSAKENEVVKI